MSGSRMRSALPLGVLLAAAGLAVLVPQAAAPAPGGAIEAVDTSDGKPRLCPPVDTSGRYVRGGCHSTGHNPSMDFDARTAFGTLPFATNCSYTFDFHVAANGRTWMDDLRIGGAGGACGDIRPCEPDALKPSREDRAYARRLGIEEANSPADFDPWAGRLHATRGSIVNRFEMCVDTCAGRFDGTVEFALVRKGRIWTVKADGAPVGSVGLTTRGEWPLEPGKFALRGAADR